MKPKTFEEWLREFHLEALDGVYDKHDLPDMFDDWVANLECEEWIKYGDLFGRMLSNEDALARLTKGYEN